MVKIGFVEHFLSEWHANNYPRMFDTLSKDSGKEFKICYAYADTDVSPYDGVTTDQWCEKFGVQKCESIEEVVEKSDVIIVLSPDNPECHEKLCELPLASGKPVYVDKTFAPDVATAKRIFDYAKKNNTPVYSSSALRFADELKEYRFEKHEFDSITVSGPADPEIYAVHFIEIIRTVIHEKPVKVKCALNDDRTCVAVFEYANGKHAVYEQQKRAPIPFKVLVNRDWDTKDITIEDKFWTNCIKEMGDFFQGGKVAVSAEETIEIMAMIEAFNESLKLLDKWIEIK